MSYGSQQTPERSWNNFDAQADGLVLLPKAGGYSSAKMIEQQNLVNKKQALMYEEGRMVNLNFHSAVQRVRDTAEGMMNDWIHNRRSLQTLLGQENRLQGLGIAMVVLAMGGLVIEVVTMH